MLVRRLSPKHTTTPYSEICHWYAPVLLMFYPIMRPPTEKFAVSYRLAHHPTPSPTPLIR